MAYYGKGLAGVDTDRRTTFKEFELGSVERLNADKVGVYGYCSAGIAAGTVGITLSTGAIASGSGYTAGAAFAAGEYGWVYKAGL